MRGSSFIHKIHVYQRKSVNHRREKEKKNATHDLNSDTSGSQPESFYPPKRTSAESGDVFGCYNERRRWVPWMLVASSGQMPGMLLTTL